MIFMPLELGVISFVVLSVALVLHTWVVYGGALVLARWLKVARLADEDLTVTAQETASRRGVQITGVWYIDGPSSLAFAMIPNRQLLFTGRIASLLKPAELGTICDHEVAHLAESRAVFFGRYLGSLALYPWVFIPPALMSGQILILIGLYFSVILLARMGQNISLKLEERADASVIEGGHDEGAYATALEKLYEENHIPAVMPKKKSTHPNLYDRMEAAGRMPDYPRPKPPAAVAPHLVLLLATAGIMLALLAGKMSQFAEGF